MCCKGWLCGNIREHSPPSRTGWCVGRAKGRGKGGEICVVTSPASGSPRHSKEGAAKPANRQPHLINNIATTTTTTDEQTQTKKLPVVLVLSIGVKVGGQRAKDDGRTKQRIESAFFSHGTTQQQSMTPLS